MTTEQIEKFFSRHNQADAPVRIFFKTRKSVTGIFIETPDSNELKTKNFWRVVSETDLAQWKKSRDYSLCRMFSGSEFTKLVSV